jgi:hypothetical protein
MSWFTEQTGAAKLDWIWLQGVSDWYLGKVLLISRVGLWVLRSLTGLLYQPRMIVTVSVEKLVKWRLAGETEVLGENFPQRHLVQHKSQMPRPGFEPGPPRWDASD